MNMISTLIAATGIAAVLLSPDAMASDEEALVGATYLGGGGGEGGQYSGAIKAAVATTGEVYVVGMTASTDFPVTPGAFPCVSCGDTDIFVAKLSGDLTTLLAATMVGGSREEVAPSVAVWSDGTVYVCGYTASLDFPATASAYDRFPSANHDVFVARFDGDLTSLLAATYLGGSGDDLYPTLDLDSAGDVIVCGVTAGGATNSFPTTPGAYDRAYASFYPDFFVSKLSGDLSQLLASTLLGGRYEEAWGGARVDPWDNIIVGGSTESDDYPSTPGAYGEFFHGPPQPGQHLHDIVVSRLSNGLDSLLASTFIGTDGFDGGQQIAVDDDGNVIVGGHTSEIDYPVTPGALDEVHNGQNEYLLTKMDNNLTAILASTFLTPDDAGFAFLTDLATDAEGNIYGVGAAWGADCPVTANAYDSTFNGGENDFIVLQLTGDLTTLSYATFLGGSGNDGDCAVAVDSVGDVVVAGYTSSPDMPVTPGAYDEIFNGGARDAFVARLLLSGTSVPVFLADFHVGVRGDVVEFTWVVGEDAAVDDFRLTARSASAQWDLPVTGVSARRFQAYDKKLAERSDTRVTYQLYTREGGEPWLLLRTETVEKRAPEPGVHILGAWPNPTAGEASVSFAVGSPQRLQVDVYDVTGRRTVCLAEGVYPVGRHTVCWDGRDANGRMAASGVYFFRVRGRSPAEIRKFTLVR